MIVTADHVEDFRALRRQGWTIVRIKALFRRAGLNDDQTVTLIWMQLNNDDLADVASRVNQICRWHPAS